MSDRIAVMNRGRDRAARRRRRRSTSARAPTFVAGFIGVSNLMPGEVVSASGAEADCGSTRARPCARRSARARRAGERCHAVVRPEKLELAARGAPRRRRTAERRGNRGVLALPRHRHADRGPAAGRREHDGAGAQRGRGRAPAAARRRRPRAAGVGAASTCTSCARRRRRRPDATAAMETTSRPDDADTHAGGSSERPPMDDVDSSASSMRRSSELTRRRLLRQGGAGALSLSAISLLAACGDDGSAAASKDEAKAIPKGEVASTLTFANWPFYIDVDDKTKKRTRRSTVREEVRHQGQVRRGDQRQRRVLRQGAPAVRAGQLGRPRPPRRHRLDGGRMKRLGFVQKFDKTQMPNAVKNIEDAVASPDFDPKREFSMPWQSGQVGLIYRKDKTAASSRASTTCSTRSSRARSRSSPRCATRSARCCWPTGVEPEKATMDQAMAAIEKLEKALEGRPDPALHRQRLTKDLLKGDSTRSSAGRATPCSCSSTTRTIKFMPAGGGLHDLHGLACRSRSGAPHAFTAQKMIDFVYEPGDPGADHGVRELRAAGEGRQGVLEKDDRRSPRTTLIFPDLTNAHNFKTFPPEEEREIDAAFQRAIGA